MNNGQYFGILVVIGMHMVRYYRVVVDTVSRRELIGILPIIDFNSSVHDVDKFLSFMR